MRGRKSCCQLISTTPSQEKTSSSISSSRCLRYLMLISIPNFSANGVRVWTARWLPPRLRGLEANRKWGFAMSGICSEPFGGAKKPASAPALCHPRTVRHSLSGFPSGCIPCGGAGGAGFSPCRINMILLALRTFLPMLFHSICLLLSQTQGRANLFNGLALPETAHIFCRSERTRLHPIYVQRAIQVIYLVLEYASIPTLSLNNSWFGAFV